MNFDNAWMRFATSGTLISLYAVADYVARRRGRGGALPNPPRWLRPLHIVSLTAFYLLIRSTGGPLLEGYGNAAGCGLVVIACALRLGRWVRQPDLFGQSLFHLGLPVAVGVPWGLLVLGLPALAASLYCHRRAERSRGGNTAAAPRLH